MPSGGVRARPTYRGWGALSILDDIRLQPESISVAVAISFDRSQAVMAALRAGAAGPLGFLESECLVSEPERKLVL